MGAQARSGAVTDRSRITSSSAEASKVGPSSCLRAGRSALSERWQRIAAYVVGAASVDRRCALQFEREAPFAMWFFSVLVWMHSMTTIVDFGDVTTWSPERSPAQQDEALATLEDGHVLRFPNLSFEVQSKETEAMVAPMLEASKNISFDPRTRRLRGSKAPELDQVSLLGMLSRFAFETRELVHALLPKYDQGLQQGRGSFRPAEISGRQTSWRKDDTRLHVDSFPSSPTGGRRILRVFSNVNPTGKHRTWELGEPFEAVASRFLPSLPRPFPGSAALLQMLRVTKTRRTAYDHYMLHLHDAMKADLTYQGLVQKLRHDFPAGSTWMVYTDQASHAALNGQYALEQTFYIDPRVLLFPEKSPLRRLESLTKRALT